MVVALVIALFALAIYLQPQYVPALLPFAALPVALATLLIGPRAPYFAAALTIMATIGALFLNSLYPPPYPRLSVPPDLSLSLGLMIVALLLLALVMAPIRSEIVRLVAQLHQHERAQQGAQQRIGEINASQEQVRGQLAWYQQHTDQILQQMNDGVITVDDKGQITRANSAAQQLWSAMATGDILDQSFKHVCDTIAGPNPLGDQVAIVQVNGQANSELTGYTHILYDRREHARLVRLRGELMGLLASEMRNPLTSMVTALEMTLGQNLPEGADRVLVGARRSAQRLLDLVTTMLEIDQIERNPNALQRNLAPLRPVLEAGIAQVSPLAQQGAVTVVAEYSGDGAVLQDTERMRRAFVYLLEAALRHSPPYSTVQVRIERQNGTLVVRISDQGAGLTLEQRDRLFDQRAAPDNRGSTPLGLSFSKLIIETHGGRIWVESAESQGTTFAFTMPIAKKST